MTGTGLTYREHLGTIDAPEDAGVDADFVDVAVMSNDNREVELAICELMRWTAPHAAETVGGGWFVVLDGDLSLDSLPEWLAAEARPILEGWSP